MPDKQTGVNGGMLANSDQKPFQAHSIALPIGGGAIRGTRREIRGQSRNRNRVCHHSDLTTTGRSNFSPQLALAYDSHAGNGPFGFGWRLSIPSISRKTEKSLPRYQDANHSDLYILSEGMDLVPSMTVNGTTDTIRRYRPRNDGLFAQIENWRDSASGETFWKVTSKVNVTSTSGVASTLTKVLGYLRPWLSPVD